jgi:HEAT repeat protein
MKMERRRLLNFFLALVGVAVLLLVSLLCLANYLDARVIYDGRPIRDWIQALKSPDVEERRRAIHALGVIGPVVDAVVPALAAVLLTDVDRRARIEAAVALLRMGPAAKPALPALIQALADRDPVIRMNVATALHRMGPAARPAVPALIRALGDARNDTDCKLFPCTIREVVAVALGHASADSAEAVPALSELLLPSEPESTRAAAARALGEIGLEATPAAPRLRPLLDDPSDRVRTAAAEALKKITGG